MSRIYRDMPMQGDQTLVGSVASVSTATIETCVPVRLVGKGQCLHQWLGLVPISFKRLEG